MKTTLLMIPNNGKIFKHPLAGQLKSQRREGAELEEVIAPGP